MVRDKNIENKFILSVDTTTRSSSVSLAKGCDIIESLTDEKGEIQSSGLLILIDRLLRSVKLNINEIDMFSIATGPGSFTGARVGISTIKGLAHSLNRVCVGVPTLKALAQAAGTSTLTLSLLSAGRGEVFAQKFEVDALYKVVSLSPAVCAPIKAILEEVKNEPNIKWIGDASDLLADEIKSFAEKTGKIYFGQNNCKKNNRQNFEGWCLVYRGYVLSESVALLTMEALRNDEVFNEVSVEYIRPTL